MVSCRFILSPHPFPPQSVRSAIDDAARAVLFNALSARLNDARRLCPAPARTVSTAVTKRSGDIIQGMPQSDWSGLPLTLSLDRITKSYGARRVLRDLSLVVSAGEVVAVTGSNGTGKSTLLRIAAGLLRPTRGAITFSLGDVQSADSAERRRNVGYASPDIAFYPELSGRENLGFFAKVRGGVAADSMASLEAVGLVDRGDDPVSAYSSGMRQRLRLAFARDACAPILLLDEPSLALDEAGTAMVASLIDAQRQRGGITLLATNDAREAALGDRTLALSR
jgi:heme exporter protein A